MEAEFWHEVWAENRLGFHQRAYNDWLTRLWPRLDVARGATVLVPLCGKSLDMRWLAGEGLTVVGVELSEIAAQAFFEGDDVVVEAVGAYTAYRSGAITILVGDYFALTRDVIGAADGVTAVYDRGALIALPPDMRRRYAALELDLMAPAGELFGLTLEYDQAVTPGPPFSVPRPEVEALYGGRAEIEELERTVTGDLPPRFIERGLTSVGEVAYRITKR